MSLAGAGPGRRMVVACNPVRVVRGSSVDELAQAWTEARAAWNADIHVSGIPIGIGFLSYDLGRRFERLRGASLSPSAWPDIDFRFFDAVVVGDTESGRAEIWASGESAARGLAAELLGASDILDEADSPTRFAPLVDLDAPARHLQAVSRALDYILAGDIYQVNLARRLGCSFPSPPGRAPGLALFARLEREALAPYSIWFADGEAGTALVGNSPECFLRQSSNGRIETWPIKGTRPRLASDASNRNADVLAASAKDRAEHVMIVDLERSDLGRVCQTGSVKVGELCRVLTLPTVHHLVTQVSGQLRPEIGLPELLRATFPGGSVTGAPKIRAMEIIDELEPARRGPYTGATGWLGAAGDLDLAVAIRTATIRESALTLWVGGGIVADSVPSEELAETWDKAQAFARVLG
jgi:para-aminobenzoate synthetase component 1